MPAHPISASVLAYSYIRFSDPSQAEGNSLRRQTKASEEWGRTRGIGLDRTTNLHDLGKSAFLSEHRRDADRYALAAFLKMVKDARLPAAPT